MSGPDVVVRDARLRDGRVVDVVVSEGRIEALAAPGEGGTAPTVLDAAGGLVTPAFVNGHLHLDKVHTLDRAGDEALGQYAGGDMGAAMASIETARRVKESYDRSWILPNVRRVLHESVRFGTLHHLAFVDVDTAAGLEGLHAVLAARAELAGVLDLQVVAFPQDGVLRDPGAAELCEEALRLGADVVGGIPWIEYSDADAQRHVAWACGLAARLGRRVAMLTDDAGDPALRTTEMLAVSMLEHGLVGRGVACHARAVGSYPQPSQRRLAGLARRVGLGFVSDPQTGPVHLPVDLFDGLGVAVALGQDDVSDAYYPFGRTNMLEVAFLAAHSLGFLGATDLERLLDLVTTKAARVLGLRDYGLGPGRRADLVVHSAERLVDLLREHAAPRWVLSAGRVVAETTSTTVLHLPPSP